MKYTVYKDFNIRIHTQHQYYTFHLINIPLNAQIALHSIGYQRAHDQLPVALSAISELVLYYIKTWSTAHSTLFKLDQHNYKKTHQKKRNFNA